MSARLNSSLKKRSKMAVSVFLMELEYVDLLMMPIASTLLIFILSPPKSKFWSFEVVFGLQSPNFGLS